MKQQKNVYPGFHCRGFATANTINNTPLGDQLNNPYIANMGLTDQGNSYQLVTNFSAPFFLIN